jgi:hypothetical protein
VDISSKKKGKKKGKTTSFGSKRDAGGDSSWVKKIAGPLLARCGTNEAVEDDDVYGITDSESDAGSDFDPERYGSAATKPKHKGSQQVTPPKYLENIEARLTGQGLDDDIESDGEDEVRFAACVISLPRCFLNMFKVNHGALSVPATRILRSIYACTGGFRIG